MPGEIGVLPHRIGTCFLWEHENEDLALLSTNVSDLGIFSCYRLRTYRDVRYGTRLGDLKENWFLLFPQVRN